MKLENAVVSWNHPKKGVWLDNLWSFDYQGTTVLVCDTEPAAQMAASRHLFGDVKTEFFRGTSADALGHISDYVFLGWPQVTECVILRGADHVRPTNVAKVIGRPTIRTAPRFKRREISPGNWTAELIRSDSENLAVLFRANKVLGEDGCSASGSTGVAFLWLLKTQNPQLSSVTFFCPIMGDIALERMALQARRLDIHLTVVCFGVYKVLPIGWKEKTETDIIIPNDDAEILRSNILAIPPRQIVAYRTAYKPNGKRGPCIVGDVGESTSNERSELLGYVDTTIAELGEFCNISIPDELIQGQSDLRGQLSAFG